MLGATMLWSLALWIPPTRLAAQGVTTGAISGTVTDVAGKPVENAQVQVVNRSTGFRSGSLTRASGYYYVQGLEVGGPYTVTVRRIGYEPAERNGVTISLSSTTRVDLQLAQTAVTLSAVTVSGTVQASTFSPAHQGVSTEVTDSLIRRIPQLNRNLTDLVKLTPQVIIPTTGGPSAGGQYNRYNNFTIDGANQNDRFNLNSSGGLPGGAGNGRIISQEAVKEFRVLMSPTDVRQANFTGMLVNAVTKSGTNEWHGGVIYNFRNEDFSATNFRTTTLDVKQYGFQIGGPIIRDRLQIFVAPEWQQRRTAAAGPFVGQVGNASGTALNISADSIAYVQQIVRSNPRFGFDPGTAGFVPVENPLTNLFGRLDFEINQTHRLVLRQLVNRTESFAFSRGTQGFQANPANQNTGFRRGSNAFNGVNTNNSTVAQLYSNFSQGTSNEFIAGFNQIRDKRVVPQVTPEIGVGVVPSTAPGSTVATAAITFGTEQFSINNRANQDIVELQDNVSIPFGAHTFTVGGRYEHLKVYNNFAQALGGVWVFPTIAALNNLQPSGYRLGYPNSGNVADIPASFNTNMTSFYGQDQWAVTPNLTITGGLRADVPSFADKPPENTTIENLFAARQITINTSWIPKTQVLWSPRIGFNWDVSGDQRNQVRGNVGVFTSPPPYILVANGYQNTGLGLVTLLCSGTATPAFTTDVNNLPKSCAGQPAPAPGAAGTAGINLTDPNFKYPQSLVTSLGADRQLPFGVVGTLEGLYRKAIHGVFIRDLNTIGPRIVNGQVYTDRNGRVLYADTITAAGVVQYFANSGQKAVTQYNNTPFSEGAIFVTNQSKDYNYTLTGQLRKQFAAGLDATVAYTYNRAYDVQSLTSDRAISNWRNGRENAALESEPTLTTSAFERRHRVLAFGTYTLPWWKKYGATDVTLYYEGISGFPIDYTAQNGDLNGDGYNGNDLIYVPRNATDVNEIKIGSQNNTTGVFTQDAKAAADAKAFDNFISSQKCLNEQRGRIMKRNSCRTPWQNRLDLAIRQSLPQVRGQNVTVELDVQNFANALGEVLQHVDGHARDWGKIYVPTLSTAFPQQAVLTQTGRTPGPLSQSYPVYTVRSDIVTKGGFANVINLGYQMALTFRYEF
jgi:hypothetical protein